ncbi:MAG: FtsX-like permease family protein [Raineya sp.]
MKLLLFVARKYFLSKKKNLFINVISFITVLVISLAVVAFILLLSVFNGLEDMMQKQYNLMNPDLKISPKKGKIFVYDKALKEKIASVNGIAVISEALEDDAVFRYKDRQIIGKVKGVTANFAKLEGITKQVVVGSFQLYEGAYARAIVGLGVASLMTMNIGDEPLEIWYPNRKQKITMSEKDIQKLSLLPIGVFEVEYEHDGKYVIVPIEFTEKLMQYSSQERSYLELKLQNPQSTASVQKELLKILGETFLVENREQQQAEILRAIRIEKLIARIALSFVFLIACFNIFFLLTMITLEKRNDIAVWQVLGAEESFIRQVFVLQGIFIAFTGAFIGLILGVALCWLQYEYGFVHLDSRGTPYPIRMDWVDFVLTFITIFSATLAASFFPAKNIVKEDLKTYL